MVFCCLPSCLFIWDPQNSHFFCLKEELLLRRIWGEGGGRLPSSFLPLTEGLMCGDAAWRPVWIRDEKREAKATPLWPPTDGFWEQKHVGAQLHIHTVFHLYNIYICNAKTARQRSKCTAQLRDKTTGEEITLLLYSTSSCLIPLIFMSVWTGKLQYSQFLFVCLTETPPSLYLISNQYQPPTGTSYRSSFRFLSFLIHKAYYICTPPKMSCQPKKTLSFSRLTVSHVWEQDWWQYLCKGAVLHSHGLPSEKGSSFQITTALFLTQHVRCYLLLNTSVPPGVCLETTWLKREEKEFTETNRNSLDRNSWTNLCLFRSAV